MDIYVALRRVLAEPGAAIQFMSARSGSQGMAVVPEAASSGASLYADMASVLNDFAAGHEARPETMLEARLLSLIGRIGASDPGPDVKLNIFHELAVHVTTSG